MLFLDFTGTLSNDEPLMRQTWLDILLENGNAVDIAGEYIHLPQSRLPSGTQAGFALTKEEVHCICGDIPIVDWKDKWENPDNNWYGVGNKRVYEDLMSFGLLPKVSSFDEIEQRIRHFFRNRIQCNDLMLRDGMYDILLHCIENDIPVAIVTNDPQDLAELKLRALGLSEDDVLKAPFHFIVTPEDVNNVTKPHPDLYLEAVARFKTALGPLMMDIVVIEDSPAGVDAAYAMSQMISHAHPVHILQYPFEDKVPLHPHADQSRKLQVGNAGLRTIGLLKSLTDTRVRVRTLTP